MVEYKYSGDSTISVKFGDEISPDVNRYVRGMRLLIERADIPGIREMVPTYCSLYVHYDPLKIDDRDLLNRLKSLEKEVEKVELPPPKVVDVPVVYGGEYGPDIGYVASYHGITVDDVIRHHANKPYLVYMLGFTPGFTFLGGVDDTIATPRLKNPRLRVPAGSVGIAGKQTGIYAISSPGGWQLIGRTYLRFYDPGRNPPTLVRAGDYVRFIPISPEEFEIHRGDIEGMEVEDIDESWAPEGQETIEVVSAGMLVTVQDRGRYGYQELGICTAGAMDEISFRIANRLLGNDDNAAALEVTFGGASFRFLRDTAVAITGGNLAPALNGSPVSMYRTLKVRAGDILSFGMCKSGFRSYLSVLDGIDVPLVMGSRATDLKARLGGYKGRKLQKGDVLYTFAHRRWDMIGEVSVNPSDFCFGEEGIFRVIEGPDDDHFTEEGKRVFFGSEFVVTDKIDRMGCRLQGPYIEHNDKGAGIISDGISFGTIQVPGEGYPIVLLKDRQAVGGYTKIATLITVDAYRFSQLKPGDKVRFEKVDVGFAHRLIRQVEERLAVVGVKARRVYKIKVNGKTYDVVVEEV